MANYFTIRKISCSWQVNYFPTQNIAFFSHLENSYRRCYEVRVVGRSLMLEARWGSRRWGCPFWQGTNCSTRGTLSTSSSSPTTPHVTSLPGKTFRPGWQNISRKTFFWQWHALSGPNVSLPSGKEIYPETKILKPDIVTSFSGGKVENNLCSFSLPSLDPSELIMAVGNKTASLNSLYLQPRLSLFNLQKQSWLQVQRIQ